MDTEVQETLYTCESYVYLIDDIVDLNSGAVKSNIGHLEGASAVAGLIKTVLVLERGIVPRNTNFERLNPKIDPDLLRIKVSCRP